MATKDKDTTDEAAAPVTRERQSMVSNVDEDTQKERQQQAVERHKAFMAENEARHLAQSTPIKLSTKEFVGKVPNEPDKSDLEEARKQGHVGNGPGVADPVEFKTIPQTHDGEVVDRIVLTPDIVKRGVPGATPLNEPQRTQATVDAHVGDDKDKFLAADKLKSDTKSDAGKEAADLKKAADKIADRRSDEKAEAERTVAGANT
jgi:hypothetical protein